MSIVTVTTRFAFFGIRQNKPDIINRQEFCVQRQMKCSNEVFIDPLVFSARKNHDSSSIQSVGPYATIQLPRRGNRDDTLVHLPHAPGPGIACSQMSNSRKHSGKRVAPIFLILKPFSFQHRNNTKRRNPTPPILKGFCSDSPPQLENVVVFLV